MSDNFSGRRGMITSDMPGHDMVLISPSNTTTYEGARGVMVLGAGDLVFDTVADDTRTVTGLAQGIIHPLRIKRVRTASTVASVYLVF